MRSKLAQGIVSLLALLVFSFGAFAQAQGRGGGQQSAVDASLSTQPSGAGFFAPGVPKMPDPPGPAPKRDINGAWIGPLRAAREQWPPMTPAGEAAMKRNKPESEVTLAATNDPFMYCDPLGLTRGIISHALLNREGVWFHEVPGQMVILQQFQRVWRNVWTDGRPLPTNINKKGGPDPTFYGTSVGHWDGDYTFVIDTTGVDDRTWLDENGHPHTTDAHFEERYTRQDQYTMQLVLTVTDPKYYAQPIELIKGTFYWMKAQDFPEAICLPSDAVAYRNSLAEPAGTGGKTGQ
jgi:hypothetical protein